MLNSWPAKSRAVGGRPGSARVDVSRSVRARSASGRKWAGSGCGLSRDCNVGVLDLAARGEEAQVQPFRQEKGQRRVVVCNGGGGGGSGSSGGCVWNYCRPLVHWRRNKCLLCLLACDVVWCVVGQTRWRIDLVPRLLYYSAFSRFVTVAVTIPFSAGATHPVKIPKQVGHPPTRVGLDSYNSGKRQVFAGKSDQ